MAPFARSTTPGISASEVRHVDQRMGAEDRQHAHVFLRVVELVEAPEHADPVIREVHEPVARVHGHDDQRRWRPSAAPYRSWAATIQGAAVRTTCTNESVSPVTSGTTSVAFNAV